MAWTQANIDQIKEAIAQGVTRATFGGRTVEFRSLDEMERTLALMQTEVSPATAPRRFRASAHDKLGPT